MLINISKKEDCETHDQVTTVVVVGHYGFATTATKPYTCCCVHLYCGFIYILGNCDDMPDTGFYPARMRKG